MFRRPRVDQAHSPDNWPDGNNPRSSRGVRISFGAGVVSMLAIAYPFVHSAISNSLGSNSSVPVAIGPQVAGGRLPDSAGDCSSCVYPGSNNRYGTTWVRGESVLYGEGAWEGIRADQNGRPYRGVLAIKLPDDTIEFVSPNTNDGKPTNHYLTKLPIGAYSVQIAMAESPASTESVIGAYSQPQSLDPVLGAPTTTVNSLTANVPFATSTAR